MTTDPTIDTDRFAAMAKNISAQAISGDFTEEDDQGFFTVHAYISDQEVRERILSERLIVRQLVRDILAAGYLVRVYDGEDFACALTNQLDVVMDAIMSTDDDTLLVHLPKATTGDGRHNASFGSVWLVYGNSPWEVISDTSFAMEQSGLMKGAQEIADGLESVSA